MLNLKGTRGTRLELNIVSLLFFITIFCVTASTCMAQLEYLRPEDLTKLSGMSPSSLLALIAILSLALSAYLIKLLFGKLLTCIDANTQSNNELARLLAERPCIRNPKND